MQFAQGSATRKDEEGGGGIWTQIVCPCITTTVLEEKANFQGEKHYGLSFINSNYLLLTREYKIIFQVLL